MSFVFHCLYFLMTDHTVLNGSAVCELTLQQLCGREFFEHFCRILCFLFAFWIQCSFDYFVKSLHFHFFMIFSFSRSHLFYFFTEFFAFSTFLLEKECIPEFFSMLHFFMLCFFYMVFRHFAFFCLFSVRSCICFLFRHIMWIFVLFG